MRVAERPAFPVRLGLLAGKFSAMGVLVIQPLIARAAAAAREHGYRTRRLGWSVRGDRGDNRSVEEFREIVAGSDSRGSGNFFSFR